jgi:uncharacterized protein YneF (UPF0154 family)
MNQDQIDSLVGTLIIVIILVGGMLLGVYYSIVLLNLGLFGRVWANSNTISNMSQTQRGVKAPLFHRQQIKQSRRGLWLTPLSSSKTGVVGGLF